MKKGIESGSDRQKDKWRRASLSCGAFCCEKKKALSFFKNTELSCRTERHINTKGVLNKSWKDYENG